MTENFHLITSSDGEDILDWQKSTIVDALFFHALRTPDLKLYTFLGDGENETDSVTASELALQASSLAVWLRKLLSPGEKAILLYESSLDYVRGLMGCLCAGLIPVSGVHPKAFGARDRFLAIRDDSAASAVIGNGKVLTEFQKVCQDAKSAEKFLWVPTDTLRIPDGDIPFRPAPENIALIQYTSGSTRTPRGVQLTHRNIAHNLFRQSEAFGYRRGDCGVNWLPLSHDMGLIGGALMTLATGGRCILLSPENVAEKPVRWLRAINRYRATLSGGPDFIYGMCARSITDDEIFDLDLTCWEVAFNGAEYIRPDTMQAFQKRFASTGFEGQSFFACYGLAEATLLVTASKRGEGVSFQEFSRKGLAHGIAVPPENALDKRLLASCGVFSEDILVRITDVETDALLPDGHVGEIRVQSPGVASGYINKPVENSRVFGSEVVEESGCFLRTGDRGFILNSALYIVGRQDNRIVIENTTLDPEDIIACLDNFYSKIRLFSTAVVLEKENNRTYLVIITELFSGSEVDQKVLAQHIGQKICQYFPVQYCRVIYLRPGAMLKTPSGKIRVSEMWKRLVSGDISIVGDETYIQPGSNQVRILRVAEGKV
ncbi:fatty acyl-AMP ligase [Gluconobacter frateurii]|uniref:fatty acyl-AMP ligase n=1 Tax=Gluconobacter frateurii TaxID=38308 RepID=UPI001F059B32|nr:fatty acyl-AMP ligase [Gluconobacter frateurii]UMM08097.1 fatty acyl-AMP ligase [Gluconobacter frateurii]